MHPLSERIVRQLTLCVECTTRAASSLPILKSTTKFQKLVSTILSALHQDQEQEESGAPHKDQEGSAPPINDNDIDLNMTRYKVPTFNVPHGLLKMELLSYYLRYSSRGGANLHLASNTKLVGSEEKANDGHMLGNGAGDAAAGVRAFRGSGRGGGAQAAQCAGCSSC